MKGKQIYLPVFIGWCLLCLMGCSDSVEEKVKAVKSEAINEALNEGTNTEADSGLGIKRITAESLKEEFAEQLEPTEDVPVLTQNDSGLLPDEQSQPESDDDSEYTTIEWTALMPQEDIDAFMNPPAYITEAEEGSLEDQISGQLKNTLAKIDDPYQRALRSQTVVAKYDGQAVRLAGFVVPLEFDDDYVITEFFLVPFFGACIHVPPPPPNQIIYVKYPKGFTMEALYNPIWVSGVLSASLMENDVAISAYSLAMSKFRHYRPEDDK